MRLQVLEISFGSVMPVGTAVRELLQPAVSAAPKAVGLPPRLKELGGRFVPTMFLYQLLHLREDCFRERARVVLPIPPHLDVNEMPKMCSLRHQPLICRWMFPILYIGSGHVW